MKVVIFGKVSPPIGGVTKSVENLTNSLKAKNINIVLCQGLDFVGVIKKGREAFLHANCSIQWKRFLLTLLGKLFFKKNIFTVHGSVYEVEGFRNLFNRLSVYFSDGVIVWNKGVYDTIKSFSPNKPILKSPCIYREGFCFNINDTSYFDRKDGCQYILLYAHTKTKFKQNDIYGVEFVLKNLHSFPDNVYLVFQDLSGQYLNDVKTISDVVKDKIIYLKGEVDFPSLLCSIDLYIRPTSIDGTSIAILESQALNIRVLASDVVERPRGVTLYRFMDDLDFIKKIKTSLNDQKPHLGRQEIDSIDSYIGFLSSI
ncbi:hypothetical protein [Endozoicomonas sp. ISHI1]|uniref:hypothetical protein n=1 Tax=Endozoicomonas sp. ISHI1 TaxID=2825882 RepID=UPI0021496310|nr:hypothetical protein [Endozoicomonas sp. ISHI1]